MDIIVAEIHIYWTEQEFLAVPVSKQPDGILLEIKPIQAVKRFGGGIDEISRLLQSASQISRENMLKLEVERWDGRHVWYETEHFAVIRFGKTKVEVFKKVMRKSSDLDESAYWATEKRESFHSEISFDILAKNLIEW